MILLYALNNQRCMIFLVVTMVSQCRQHSLECGAADEGFDVLQVEAGSEAAELV